MLLLGEISHKEIYDAAAKTSLQLLLVLADCPDSQYFVLNSCQLLTKRLQKCEACNANLWKRDGFSSETQLLFLFVV